MLVRTMTASELTEILRAREKRISYIIDDAEKKIRRQCIKNHITKLYTYQTCDIRGVEVLLFMEYNKKTGIRAGRVLFMPETNEYYIPEAYYTQYIVLRPHALHRYEERHLKTSGNPLHEIMFRYFFRNQLTMQVYKKGDKVVRRTRDGLLLCKRRDADILQVNTFVSMEMLKPLQRKAVETVGKEVFSPASFGTWEEVNRYEERRAMFNYGLYDYDDALNAAQEIYSQFYEDK